MSALDVAADVAEFVAEHVDLVHLIESALAGGVTKEQLVASIKAQMTAASDAMMRAELGGGPDA